ncbi:MAG: TonB-dependent receptor [Acidobacteriaceae bacterium]|nr:TonB-dependent receptor [Acidobacteriaceae bacterium]
MKYNQDRYELYVQDDWKATSKLTLNLGIRYELEWQRPNAYNADSMFIPGINKVVVFAKSYPAATIPLLKNSFPVVLASDVGLPSNIWDYLGQDPNNLAPRVGLAYKLGAKTVMRAAFGMYYSQLPMLDVNNPLSMQLPFAAVETFSQPSGPRPAFNMSNPFPGNGTVPANPVVNVEPKPVTPYTLQWNYAVERELPQQIGLRIGYIGQRNLKENYFHGSGTVFPDLNAVVPAPGNVQVRRPIQPFSTINYEPAPIFQSTTESLQVGVHKRYSGGLLVNGEYQYVRALGTENFVNPMKWNDSRGNLGGIRTHVLQVSYSYELPFGRGKRLLANTTGFAGALASGWVLSGISSFLSGAPFSVTCSTSVQGSVCGRADIIAGAALYPAKQTIAQWFNPAAFAKPPDFTYGNSAYNMLWGPGQQNWDASIAKNTRLQENVNLQLRLDAFSVFNHPQFGNPSANISNTATVATINSASGNRTVQIGAKIQF